MTDDELHQTGHLIRAYLEPLWIRMHESDLKWGRSKQMPSPLSSAMCRHTSLFTKRLLEGLGQNGWKIVSGDILREGMATPPGYVIARDASSAPHWWLSHPEHGQFDLTADQFGLAEVITSAPGVPLSDGYEQHPRVDRVGSLTGMMRNWEGDERGSWWGHEVQRAAYEKLQQDVRASLGMGVESEIEESTTFGM
jgi:hypothetical protein